MADKAKPVKGHYITLGDGRRVTLGQYVDAWKKTKATDPDAWVRGAPNADHRAETYRARDALQQFRAGMDDRINSKDPRYGKGRKWDDTWQRDARRLSDTLRMRSEVRPGEAHPVDLRRRLAAAGRLDPSTPLPPEGGTRRPARTIVVKPAPVLEPATTKTIGGVKFSPLGMPSPKSRPTPQVPAMKGMTPMGASEKTARAKPARVTKADIPDWPRSYWSNGWDKSGQTLLSEQKAKWRLEDLNKDAKTKADEAAKVREVLSGRVDRVRKAVESGNKSSPDYPRHDGAPKKWGGVGVGNPMSPQKARWHLADLERSMSSRIAEAEKAAKSAADKAERTAKALATYEQRKTALASSKTDAPVKVADAVPHKGTKIPAAPKGTAGRKITGESALTKLMQEGASIKSIASEMRITESAVRGRVERLKTKGVAHGPQSPKTASKRSPSKTSTSAPAATHAAEKAVRATERKEAAVVNKQMTEPKAPTAPAETAKPARLTPYQQSLQAPPRQLSHARDHMGKLDPLYTSKSRRQLVEEGVKKGIGTRSELRALQPEALAKRLKYRGLAGLAVAVVAGGAAALMTRSSTAAAAPPDSGKVRTDPYTDSLGRQYKHGRLIVRQQ